nr:putative ribonuclease H-like domain-containing protein [Tanacetum cinerariifolium]
QPIETTFQAATPVLASPKSNSSGKRGNRKACFICKSVDHLIKDRDFHAKKMAKPAQRNYANRGSHKQYALKPLKHSVPTTVLTQSKPVSNTTVRPVSAVLPYIPVTCPRHANQVVPMVSAAQGKQGTWGNPQLALQDKGVINCGCSRRMTGNMSYLSEFEELNGGYVAFRGNPKGGKITGKGKIKTRLLLPDESQVLLRVPIENNMYNVNLKNIVPSRDLTCLFAKATLDESNLWHRRLAHVNFKTLNKLVKGNIVRGLPTNVFENDHTCVACKKGKKHRASCKTKLVCFVEKPLFRLHMDLFGPTFVKSLSKKSYCLVIIDDYSRFTWVFFLATRDEITPILKTFITGLENQLSLKVKKPEFKAILSLSSSAQSKDQDDKTMKEAKGKSPVESVTGYRYLNAEFQDCFENSSNEVPTASTTVPTIGQNTLNSTNTFSAAGLPNTAVSLTYGDTSQFPDDLDMPGLEDIIYSDDEAVVGAEADFNNLESSILVCHIPTTSIHKDHPEEPKRVHQALKDPSWIEAMQEELLQFKMFIPSGGYHAVSSPYTGTFIPPKPDLVFNTAHIPVETDHLAFNVQLSPTKPEQALSYTSRPSAPIIEDWVSDSEEESKPKYPQQSVLRQTTTGKEILNPFTAGVNTPRSDEDRLEILKLMVFVLLKSTDITRLQALVDKKKVMISKAVIRDVLRLDDAEGVDCLPNEEIFTGLARVGYEKPSTKLTFYKSFFLSQWKFLIHTILQLLSAKRTSWNEFSSAIAFAVICLSTGRKFNFSKYIFDSLVRNVDNSSKFYMYPRFIQLIIQTQLGDLSTYTTTYISPALTQKVIANMRRVEKGFLGAETPLFEGMIVVQENMVEGIADEQVQDDVVVTTASEDVTAAGRMIDELNRDEGVALMGEKEEEQKAKEVKVTAEPEVQEVVEVVTTANLITEVFAAASAPVSTASIIIHAAETNILAATITAAPVKVDAASTRRRRGVVIRDPEEESSAKTSDETKSKDKGKGIMVEDPKPIKKKQHVEMDEAYARKLYEELNQDIDWDVAIEHVKQKAKEDPFIQRYQVMKKRPLTEAQARRNMIMYLKNTAGFKLDYFKGESYDDIRLIFEAKFNTNMEFLLKSKEQIEEEENRALESINETPAQKAAKRRRLNQEDKDVKEIKHHLEIMPDKDEDVYTKATPLARKVPVVDYHIIHLNNKPRYKIIRADETYQLYVSFITLLKNFDREDLESLWSIVKERFSTSKPNNFSDEYLLTTLKTMFQRPDRQDNSLKKNTKCVNAAGEELSAVKHKLMLLHTAAESRVNTAK